MTGAIQSGTKQRRDHQQEECCELRLPDGGFYFDNQPNMLDQFMVNKNMATGDAQIKVNPGTAQILKPPARTTQIGGPARVKPAPRGHHSGRRYVACGPKTTIQPEFAQPTCSARREAQRHASDGRRHVA